MAQMATPTLSLRALNRATLARQHLLDRADLSAYDLTTHLAGFQAQTPHSWYVGFWSRLRDFRATEVTDLLVDRRLVRIALMRSTIHLVTDADCLAWRDLIAPELIAICAARSANTSSGSTATPSSPPVARSSARRRRPSPPSATRSARSSPNATPPRWRRRSAPGRRWCRSRHVASGPKRADRPSRRGSLARRAGRSCARSSGARPALPRGVRPRFRPRYAGLVGPHELRAVFEGLRPELADFPRDAGLEFFDLPDAPRPAATTPPRRAPSYDYDNLSLSHADRRASSPTPIAARPTPTTCSRSSSSSTG